MNPAPPRDPYAPGSRMVPPLSWPSNGPQSPPPQPPPHWNDTAYAPPAAAPAAPASPAPTPAQPAATGDAFAAFPPARQDYVPATPPPQPDPWAGLNGGTGSFTETPYHVPAAAVPAPGRVAAPPAMAPQAYVQALPPEAPAAAPYAPAHGAHHARSEPEPRIRTRTSPRRRTWLIVVVVTVVLAAGATAAYLVLSRDGSSSTSQSAATDPGPTGAVSRFLTGVQKRDYDAAAAEVCTQTGVSAAQLGAVFDQQFAGGIQSFQVEPPASADPGKPTVVKYTLTSNGETATYQASLTQRDGKSCITENRRVG